VGWKGATNRKSGMGSKNIIPRALRQNGRSMPARRKHRRKERSRSNGRGYL
jgi:hypothetical protein